MYVAFELNSVLALHGLLLDRIGDDEPLVVPSSSVRLSRSRSCGGLTFMAWFFRGAVRFDGVFAHVVFATSYAARSVRPELSPGHSICWFSRMVFFACRTRREFFGAKICRLC